MGLKEQVLLYVSETFCKPFVVFLNSIAQVIYKQHALLKELLIPCYPGYLSRSGSKINWIRAILDVA